MGATESETRTCLKKRGRFCGSFFFSRCFFFSAFTCDEFYGRKKNGLFSSTSRERFLLFWYL
jgi:hypothetical protein